MAFLTPCSRAAPLLLMATLMLRLIYAFHLLPFSVLILPKDSRVKSHSLCAEQRITRKMVTSSLWIPHVSGLKNLTPTPVLSWSSSGIPRSYIAVLRQGTAGGPHLQVTVPQGPVTPALPRVSNVSVSNP
jgi:hypothetical protein